MPEANPLQAISNDLVEPRSAFRHVVGDEERRVEELLDTTYFNPDEAGGRLARVGKRLLIRAGVRQPAEPEEIPRPWLADSQNCQLYHIGEDLRISRERLRESVTNDIDRIAIDAGLGIRDDDSILPTTIRLAHQQAESTAGREISFVDWMSDHATDEQLLNVWQWHDSYLRQLDEAPEFNERIERVKASYTLGLDAAIAAGELSPGLAMNFTLMDTMQFRHGSPLSPVRALVSAHMVRSNNTVYIWDAATDSTLFHEITHGIGGGLIPELDEGATDLIAARIYGHSPQAQGQGSYQYAEVYRDDIVSLELIEELSGGACGLYALSEAYAGSGESRNTVKLLQALNDNVGLPVGLPLIETARAAFWAAHDLGRYDRNTVSQYAAYILRRTLSIISDAIRDNDTGRHHVSSVDDLMSGILSKRVVDKYGHEGVLDGLDFALKVGEAQKASEE